MDRPTHFPTIDVTFVTSFEKKGKERKMSKITSRLCEERSVRTGPSLSR